MPYSQVFEDIWKEYPRKSNKEGAYRCFQARCKEGESAAFMFACTKEYVKQVMGTEEKFILLPSTFYGCNHRYKDYKPKPQVKKQAVKKRTLLVPLTPAERSEVAVGLTGLVEKLSRSKRMAK